MSWKRIFRSLILAAGSGLAGCATQPPVPFQLIDQQSIAHAGVYNPNDQSMQVTIGNKAFRGFYIVATGTGYSTTDTFFPRRFGPLDTYSSISSNSARALLRSDDGESITCQFLFQNGRAIGDCTSSRGKTFQFVASGRM